MGSNGRDQDSGLADDEYYVKASSLIVRARVYLTNGQVPLTNGSTSRANAGDWLVTYPNGDQRTVSAAAFDMLFAK